MIINFDIDDQKKVRERKKQVKERKRERERERGKAGVKGAASSARLTFPAVPCPKADVMDTRRLTLTLTVRC
ncbi:hypothetical protein T4E_6260 [Trichinella pseudospiralis]|uniref:Uncharacterized protein n=1 Tax=Trichinella pseudospiralis TaxID=6337 RepID=A0A0V0YI81_TRIPS|nr:hypothetical protein T4E_6260 [Trichinella pseudospiralis]